MSHQQFGSRSGWSRHTKGIAGDALQTPLLDIDDYDNSENGLMNISNSPKNKKKVANKKSKKINKANKHEPILPRHFEPKKKTT
jgi:hypothetical protein